MSRALIRKAGIVGLLLWTLVVTVLRAVRLPNDFSKAHWFLDYRFGFIKRGLVGEIVSLATSSIHIRPTEQLVVTLSSVQFVVFCVVLAGVGLRLIQKSGWSSAVILMILVFSSSPFIVMSAHLVGYFDNIIIVLAVISVAVLLTDRIWSAAAVQAIAILVHENALLVGFPVFCLCWLLINRRHHESNRAPLPWWPLGLPLAAFLVIALSQSLARPDLELFLLSHLSTFPFIEKTILDTRVPHWITITFFESYALHRGYFSGRVLSEPMLGLVLPSMLAILGLIVEAYRVQALSTEAIVLLGVCLLPQTMHVVAWDTTRIWTYSILASFLSSWVYAEVFAGRRDVSQFVRLVSLAALVLNATELTPLMDGLHEHFDLTTRMLLYTPVLGTAVLILWDESVPSKRKGWSAKRNGRVD